MMTAICDPLPAASRALRKTILQRFTIGTHVVERSGVLISVLSGLWSGLLIGYVTEYYLNNGSQTLHC